MATDTNGAVVNLERVPLKYEGLQPWEIFISEAQERMSLSVPAENYKELQRLADIHEVEISEIGRFTDSGFLEIYYEEKAVALIDMDFLHNGGPKYQLEAIWERTEDNHVELESYQDYNNIMFDIISRLNIASKEEWVRQYDHEVQGRSAQKPFCGKDADGPSDAAVVRISPFKKTAIVASHGLKPTFSDIDAYWMTASVIDEAVRNAVSVGADPDFMSGLDNFCWPDPVYDAEKNPDGKDKLASLVRSNMALYDICKEYKIPLISGKDSMKNDYGSGKNKISIPPTLLFTLISKMDNVENMTTMDFKSAGDLVYILGVTADEMGGSEYFHHHGINRKGFVPKLNAAKNMANYRKLHAAINSKLVASAHDLSDGGLAVSAAESAFSGGLGVKIELSKVPQSGNITRDDIVMFSESNGRILLSVKPANKAAFEKIMSGADIALIGEVTSSGFMKVLGLNSTSIVNVSTTELKECWKAPLKKLN